MKKFVSLFAALSIVVTGAAIGSSAADLNQNVFCYKNDREVIIEDDSISKEKMQFIADYIVDESHNTYDEASPYGIACLFGHSLKTTYATETSHNAYSTSPKCLIKEYKVQYCTRSSCDYIKKELTSSYRTASCHG